jgi:hypothetical protein
MSWGVVSPIKHRPATPSGTSNAAPWASTTAPKKTLREIQMEEEEEARKAKAAQQQAASLASAVSQAANTSHGSAANSSGKGYAGIVGNTGIRVSLEFAARNCIPLLTIVYFFISHILLPPRGQLSRVAERPKHQPLPLLVALAHLGIQSVHQSNKQVQ